MTNAQLFASLQAGDPVLGCSLKECLYLKEQSCRMWHLVHDKSGAELLYFEDGREEKCFSLAFPVSPADDTGVFHIIEHCLVEGSEKYRVNRWVEKGPQNSMLGAFTSMDNSMYAVTSEIEQNFQDLVRIYSASIFDSLIMHTDIPLLQEGWRYQYDAEKDALDYVGVVYSEMTASLEYPDFLATLARYRAAFPDSLYSRNIGGAPEAIPELTNERMKKIYRAYYCPENCLAVVSGDTNLAEVIETLSEYWEDTGHGARCITKAVPAVWNGEPLRMEYPVLEEDSRQAMMGFSWILGDSRVDMLRGRILAKLLSAPLSEALKDCADAVQVSCETESLYPMLCVAVRNADAKELDTVREKLLTAVSQLLHAGVSEDTWQAAVSEVRFLLQEGQCLTPEGVQNALEAIVPFAHGKPLAEYLQYLENMDRIRDEGWEAMRGFLKNSITENDLHSEYVLVGSATLAKRRMDARQLRLTAARNRMTADDLAEIHAAEARYQQYLAAGDNPAAEKALPKTELRDLPQAAPGKQVTERQTPMGKVLFGASNEDLIRMTLFFPVTIFDEDTLHHLGVLVQMLGKTAVQSGSAEQISNRLRCLTGGLRCSLNWYAPEKGNLVFLEVSIPMQPACFPEGQALLAEILTKSRFDDPGLLQRVLQEYLGDACGGMPEVGTRIRGHYFPGAAAWQYACGEEFKSWLQSLMGSFAEQAADLTAKLEKVCAEVLDLSRAAVSISCPESGWEQVKQQLVFPSVLQQECYCRMPVLPEREIFRASGNMQFTAQGAIPLERTGALMAACEAIHLPLAQQLRGVGGAYRAMVTVHPEGDVVLETGRDPNLLSTLQNFDTAADLIRDSSDTALRAAQISAALNFSGRKSAQIGAYRKDRDHRFALRNYWNGMQGDRREQLWQEILEASTEDIRQAAELLSPLCSRHSYCSWATAQRTRELENTPYSPAE